jgi:hypothetical protein
VAEFLAAGAAIAGFRPSVLAEDAQLSPTLAGLVGNFSGGTAAGKTLLNKLSLTAYNQGTAAFRAKYAVFTNKADYTGHAAHAYDAFNVLMKGYVEDAKKPVVVERITIATPLKSAFVGELAGAEWILQCCWFQLGPHAAAVCAWHAQQVLLKAGDAL